MPWQPPLTAEPQLNLLPTYQQAEGKNNAGLCLEERRRNEQKSWERGKAMEVRRNKRQTQRDQLHISQFHMEEHFHRNHLLLSFLPVSSPPFTSAAMWWNKEMCCHLRKCLLTARARAAKVISWLTQMTPSHQEDIFFRWDGVKRLESWQSLLITRIPEIGFFFKEKTIMLCQMRWKIKCTGKVFSVWMLPTLFPVFQFGIQSKGQLWYFNG